MSILTNQSLCRRRQHRWLRDVAKQIDPNQKLLDLGGVANAEYHHLIALKNEQIVIWNLAPNTKPDALVDLDLVSTYPRFPQNCKTVLAFNLLEHLYRPLDLMKWAAMSLPSGGKLMIAVPFMYPIHPSPSDYWRMTPELFERFFAELKKSDSIDGTLAITTISDDLSDATALVTSPLFKSHALHRLTAMIIESLAKTISFIASCLGFKKQIQIAASTYPSAIGVVWTKK